jgi:taurine dioxygenase
MVGLDLSRPLPPKGMVCIQASLLAHHVIIFPGQSLTREQLFALAANFGEVEAHGEHRGETKRRDVAHVLSNLDAQGRPSVRYSKAANYHWHTDKPYLPAPPLLTMLHAVELPPRGGDTEFADLTLAYDALASQMRRAIAGLRVAFGPAFDPGRGTTAEHPLVLTHPDTGRKSLYLGNHATHIVGLPAAESDALLHELLAHATQPRFVYTHCWRLGDLVMWDNRCLLHRVVPGEGMLRYPRILYRSVVKGTVPF